MERRIPHFNREEEEAEFWSTHSLMDYIDETEPEHLTLDPELQKKIRQKARLKKRITLRLDHEQIEAAKEIAEEKGLPYQTLIRVWIVEGIKREQAGARLKRTNQMHP